jgi:hypothetical protein
MLSEPRGKGIRPMGRERNQVFFRIDALLVVFNTVNVSYKQRIFRHRSRGNVMQSVPTGPLMDVNVFQQIIPDCIRDQTAKIISHIASAPEIA